MIIAMQTVMTIVIIYKSYIQQPVFAFCNDNFLGIVIHLQMQIFQKELSDKSHFYCAAPYQFPFLGFRPL